MRAQKERRAVGSESTGELKVVDELDASFERCISLLSILVFSFLGILPNCWQRIDKVSRLVNFYDRIKEAFFFFSKSF